MDISNITGKPCGKIMATVSLGFLSFLSEKKSFFAGLRGPIGTNIKQTDLSTQDLPR